MGSMLTNGVFLPTEGERNCYEGLAANWVALDGMIGGYSAHAANLTIHVTAADKEAWNGKADASALTAHTGNTTIHVTAADKAKWDAVTSKADASALTAHTGNTTIHVTAADKQTWDTVTTKANDTDVLHKSGDETKTGKLTVTELNTTKINNLNPGALSLPDLTAGVDISAYITDITGASNINKFTPTADGWISIGLANADFIEIYIPASLMGGSFTKSTVNNYGQAFLPVMANKEVHITLKGTSIGWAKFYPCRGNI